jgi:hypothetical protein
MVIAMDSQIVKNNNEIFFTFIMYDEFDGKD